MGRLDQQLFIYDLESDGLLDEVSKIHCLSYSFRNNTGQIVTRTTTDYDQMRAFFLKKGVTRIGHNIMLYDELVAKKILGIDLSNNKDSVIDTWWLSMYLFPKIGEKKHGLEAWGEELNVKKPIIKDWKNLSVEEYKHRCETDTIINLLLWEKEFDLLTKIYGSQSNIERFIDYLMNKVDCVVEQEDEKLRVDVPMVEQELANFQRMKQEKDNLLASVMPKVNLTKKREYKNCIVVSDDEVYQQGDLMFGVYESQGYEIKESHILSKVIGQEDPNPNSVTQLKNWMFSLGWEPITFKAEKDDDGKIRNIPQITVKDEDEDRLCDSVLDLAEKTPAIKELDGKYVLQHRIGILKGILKQAKETGFVRPSAKGLTNTLRFRHRNIVNLPKTDKPYGGVIRGSFIANENQILCGSDMTGLEGTTQDHWIFYYDKEYVEEKRQPGFDPHLDLAVLSGIMTKDEEKFFKYMKSKK